ncbi:hypothetical protein GS538_09855 [Rhodococcus hoagii]|nr:hypothetical protein [Prescottella equi]
MAGRASGVTPDYETVVSLMGAAWESARSKVLSEELYPQVTEEVYQRVTATDELIEQERQQRIESARQEQDPERWKTLNVEVSPLARRSSTGSGWASPGGSPCWPSR